MQDKVKKTIEEMFSRTASEITKIEFSNEGGMLWCLIETPDSRFMIGKDGETLRSINHLVQKIIEKDLPTEDSTVKILVDINGYQKKRFDNLKNIAHMMAERARYFKSNIEVDPMPAYERRIVHMFLEGAPDIKTESEGEGQNRRVVIKYINPSEKII